MSEKRRLIRGGGGGGFTARISSKVRPQDPGCGGGGATQIAVPRGVVDMEVMSSSVVEPQSVSSRILVVLVKEAKVRGTECLVSSRVDRDRRLLAGVASPASATVVRAVRYRHVLLGRCPRLTLTALLARVGRCAPLTLPQGPDGTLSSSDLAGILFLAVPAGIPFPEGPVGPHGMLSPSDSDSVGPYVTLSPSDYDYVGPVGPYGTLSPSDSVAGGPVGPDGTLSSSDLAGILFPAVPAGRPFPVGPVGPLGTLSLPDSDSVVLVVLICQNEGSGHSCWVTVPSGPCWAIGGVVPV